MKVDTFIVTVLLLGCSCAYYTEQELKYMDGMLELSSRQYADAKTEEAIPRARAEKFRCDGDSVHYVQALQELKALQVKTDQKRQLMEEVREKRDHIKRHCCR